MKNYLFVIALGLSLSGWSQTLCGTANEAGSITLTAPAGNVFTSITFASYGTPNGSCGSFTIGSCHASNSQSIVEAEFLGKNTATIAAINPVFGDPCNGTTKRLYIEAVYSSTLPLHLVSFSCNRNATSVLVQWSTTAEVNTRAFDVERSTDGIHFSAAGTVTSRSSSGTQSYSFTDNSLLQQAYFYRLKMMDQDGSFTYSKIIKTGAGSAKKLNISPNPVINELTIEGLNSTGYVEIADLQGARLERISITGNKQIINLAAYSKGVYILKHVTDQNIEYRKFVKQ
jgi:hypothetical protein